MFPLGIRSSGGGTIGSTAPATSRPAPPIIEAAAPVTIPGDVDSTFTSIVTGCTETAATCVPELIVDSMSSLIND